MKIKYLIFLSLFLFLNFANAEKSIVFLDLDFVVQNSNVGKGLIKKFDNKMRENQLKIDEDFKKLIQNERSLVKKKNIISKEEFNKELLNLEKEKKSFDTLRKKTITEFNKEKQISLQSLVKKINEILVLYSEENKTSLIMNKKNLIIGKNELDITSQILELVNKKIKK